MDMLAHLFYSMQQNKNFDQMYSLFPDLSKILIAIDCDLSQIIPKNTVPIVDRFSCHSKCGLLSIINKKRDRVLITIY